MSSPVSQSAAGTAEQHKLEVEAGQRFEFGANWSRFLEHLSDERIQVAEQSLIGLLGISDLRGRSFVDIGSGSGLFSLAARRLGARVVSIDFDPQSVACTQQLRQMYFPDDTDWKVTQGSILDPALVKSLGTFDIVYSWGVLHHTGSMWDAIEGASQLVAPGGRLCIAIYNAQVYWTSFYTVLKRWYVKLPRGFKWLVSGPFIASQIIKGLIKDLVLLRDPRARYRARIRTRGMTVWYDWIDWIGGYPFEVATPDEIFKFGKKHDFQLETMATCGGGPGCNEFVFLRRPAQ